MQNFQHLFYKHLKHISLDIVPHLQIPNIHDVSNVMSHHNPVLAAINTFQNNPSVLNIKHRGFNSISCLKNTHVHKIRKTIKNSNVRKAC